MHVGLLAQLLSFRDGYRQAGVSRYIEHLLRYLPDELGAGSRVLALAGRQARFADRVAPFPEGVEWEWTRWPTVRIPVRILWEQCAVPVLGRTRGLDLIHGPVNVVPLAGRTPSVVTIHDLAFLVYLEQYPSMQRRYLKTMTSASVRKARRVIAVSSYTARDVAERLGVSEEKVVAVPNGVSEEFHPRAGTDELERFRSENRLPADFLLFVGTLQPRKNLLGLLRAYATLDRSDRLPLYVVGAPGWMYEEIFDEVRALGIAGDVHFSGYAASNALPLWYSAATAFVYPSFYEGFGLPVLEAMACGTPVVTSSTSSLPEVVGEAGIQVDPRDIGEIASAIARLLGDSALRDRLSLQGIEQARQFTWRRTARETAAVYRSVVDGA